MSWWILLNVQTAVSFAALAVFVYLRRPPFPLWPSLFFALVCMTLWSVGELGTVYAPTRAWKHAALVVLYAGSIFLAPACWVTAFRFAEVHDKPFRWARPALIHAPLWLGLVFWLALATNAWHGAFLTPVVGAPNQHHWLWWIAVAVGFSELFAVCALYAVLRYRVRDSAHLRSQATIILVASLLPLLTITAQSLTGPWQWPVDLGLLAGWLMSLLFVVGIYRTRLFDLSPVALREVMKGDPSGVLLANDNGRLLVANPAAKTIFGGLPLTPDADLAQALAPRLRRVRSGTRPGDPQTLWAEIVEHDSISTGELYALDAEPKRWLWITTAPIPLRRGSTSAYSIRVQDVTALYELEQSRREMAARLERDARLRSLGILAGGIAHEINNPVGSILATAQLAQSSRGAENEAELVDDALDTIAHEARRCGEIVKGVLRFARGESNEKWPGRVNDAIRAARDQALSLLEREQATLELDLSNDLPPVQINPTSFEQMFDNLIRNALQAGAGRLDIRSEAIPGGVRVTLRDDGAGIAAEDHTRAFEPFYTGRRIEGGTGLGLSVVHGIVSDHAGEIELEDEPGGGTRIVISLPEAGAVPGGNDRVDRGV